MFLLALFRKKQRRGLGTRPGRRSLPRVEMLESRLVPYSVSGNAWPHPELVTLSFVPDGTNLGGASSNLFAKFDARWATPVWQHEILRAAQHWAQHTNLNFTVLGDSGADSGSGLYQQGDPQFGDIRIGGRTFNSTILAMAYLPPPENNYSIAGDYAFNTTKAFNIGSNYDLFTVAAHEFGHSLGLLHSTNGYAVMYGYYKGVKTRLHSDDIAGIRHIYSGQSARFPDRYDADGNNDSFSSATDVSAQLDATSLAGVVSGLDVTTTSDVDYYQVAAPEGSSGTLRVKVQSSGLSLLAPSVTVYDAGQNPLGSASYGGDRGAALSVSVSGVTPGQVYYVRVAGANTSPFGTGLYGMMLNFGTGDDPAVPLPNTQTPNGDPLSGGGGQAWKLRDVWQGRADVFCADGQGCDQAHEPGPASTGPAGLAYVSTNRTASPSIGSGGSSAVNDSETAAACDACFADSTWWADGSDPDMASLLAGENGKRKHSGMGGDFLAPVLESLGTV